jgi:hypothetical protein
MSARYTVNVVFMSRSTNVTIKARNFEAMSGQCNLEVLSLLK